jgi:hypothetical protein
MKNESKSELTQSEINEMKAKHKSVFLIEVDGRKAYLKAPGRKELSYAASTAGKDPMAFNDAILKSCWLAGDEEIKTDDRLFMGVAAKLDQIIETAEAEIKKL